MGKKYQQEKIFVIQALEKHFNRGTADQWVNRDFIDLSREVLKTTKVRLSPETLKRIVGKVKTEEDYQPQEATWNALKAYANFSEEDIQEVVLQEPSSQSSSKSMLYISLAAVTILVAGFLLFLMPEKESQFLIQSIEGKNPTTVFFNTENLAEGQFIDFDEGKAIPANPNQTEYSYFYSKPGVYNPTLKGKDNKVLKQTQPIYVGSKGWEILSRNFSTNNSKKERWFPVAFTKELDKKRFHQSGLDTLSLIETYLSNVNIKGKQATSFQLNTQLSPSSPWPGMRCNTIRLLVFTSGGNHEFSLVQQGCSHWVSLKIAGENIIDKSIKKKFAVEMLDTLNIEVTQEKTDFNIKLNETTLLYKTTSKLDTVFGCAVYYHGLPEIHSIELLTENESWMNY